MLIVLIACWLRFFVYFLVYEHISKLLLTLTKMVGDAVSFVFIVACFLLLTASVFTTLYQDYNPEKYGDLRASVATLFDASLAVYSYLGMGS
jgi:uncharacterized membrane protein (DUF485 family)